MCCIILYLCFQMLFKSRYVSFNFVVPLFSSTFSALLQLLIWRAFSRILQRCRQRPLPALTSTHQILAPKASNLPSTQCSTALAFLNLTCKEISFTTGSMGQGSTDAALWVRKRLVSAISAMASWSLLICDLVRSMTLLICFTIASQSRQTAHISNIPKLWAFYVHCTAE